MNKVEKSLTKTKSLGEQKRDFVKPVMVAAIVVSLLLIVLQPTAVAATGSVVIIVVLLVLVLVGNPKYVAPIFSALSRLKDKDEL